MEKRKIAVGDRVTLSALGRERNPRVRWQAGTVLKVLVTVGERVERGQTLIILEAMKMELPLRALDGAVVGAVRCREGELVQADALLVDFTTGE